MAAIKQRIYQKEIAMEKRRSTRLHIGFALCLASATMALPTATLAVPIASESFSYADGALAGSNGGSGWAGAWTGGGTTSSGVATINGAPGFRALATSLIPSAGTAVYASFYLGADSSGSSDFPGLSFYTAGGANERIFFGMNFNSNLHGINVTNIDNINSPQGATVTPRLLIAEILFSGATAMTANLFLDSEFNQIASYTGSFLGGNWDSIRIASAGSPNPVSTFDDIRIGTILNDVRTVPEPASMLLVLTGLLMAPFFRRWRSR